MTSRSAGLGLAALAASAAALAGCAQRGGSAGAQAAAADGRQCFYAEQVNGFRAVSDELVYVSVGANDVYAFELLGSCPQIDWAQRIGVISRGGSWVCSGLDATLVAPAPTGPLRCPVSTVRKLSPAETAALPASARP